MANRHLNRLQRNRGKECEITVSPNFEEAFKKIFFGLEIEILTGRREVLADGSIRFTMELPEDKFYAMHRAISKTIITGVNKN